MSSPAKPLESNAALRNGNLEKLSLLTSSKVFLTTFLIAVVFLGGWRYWSLTIETPLVENADEIVVMQVMPGSHFHGVMSDLQWLGLTRPSWLWRVYGRLNASRVHVGEYRLFAESSLETFVESMVLGREWLHSITFVEGWTLARLRSELLANPRIISISHNWTDQQLMEALGCAGCFAEGSFLPETYFYRREDTDLELLERAYQGMQNELAMVWDGRQSGLPLATPEELLILASMIEKETSLESERGHVSGVFIRRLSMGMRLQTDPTVIYGLGDDYDGSLTRQDLRTDHPWNTYTRNGLPQTPIALPGQASLRAAAHPLEGDALYFVSKGDGSHVFSATLEEHNRAVRKYIRGRE